jgi:hypothetical protein
VDRGRQRISYAGPHPAVTKSPAVTRKRFRLHANDKWLAPQQIAHLFDNTIPELHNLLIQASRPGFISMQPDQPIPFHKAYDFVPPRWSPESPLDSKVHYKSPTTTSANAYHYTNAMPTTPVESYTAEHNKAIHINIANIAQKNASYFTVASIVRQHLGFLSVATVPLQSACFRFAATFHRPIGQFRSLVPVRSPKELAEAMLIINASLKYHGAISIDTEHGHFTPDMRRKLKAAKDRAAQLVIIKDWCVEHPMYAPFIYILDKFDECRDFVATVQIAVLEGISFVIYPPAFIEPGTLNTLAAPLQYLLCDDKVAHVEEGNRFVWGQMEQDSRLFQDSFNVKLSPNSIDLAKMIAVFEVNNDDSTMTPQQAKGASMMCSQLLLTGAADTTNKHFNHKFFDRKVQSFVKDSVSPPDSRQADGQYSRLATPFHHTTHVYHETAHLPTTQADSNDSNVRALQQYAACDAQMNIDQAVIIAMTNPQLQDVQIGKDICKMVQKVRCSKVLKMVLYRIFLSSVCVLTIMTYVL